MKTQIDTKTAVLAVVVLIVLIAGMSSMLQGSSKDTPAPAPAKAAPAKAAPASAAPASASAPTPAPAPASSKAAQRTVYNGCKLWALKGNSMHRIGVLWATFATINHLSMKQFDALDNYCIAGARAGGAS